MSAVHVLLYFVGLVWNTEGTSDLIISVIHYLFLCMHSFIHSMYSRAEDWDLSNPLKTCRLTVDRMDQSCWIQLFVDAWKPLQTEDSTGSRPAAIANPSITTTGARKVESSLFCRSIITVTPNDATTTTTTTTSSINNNNNDTTATSKVRHMVEPVVDSSRYFVVKIQSTTPTSGTNTTSTTTTTTNNNTNHHTHNTHRTAHIGLGFRERDDASNFILALQDYEKSRHREFQANKMLQEYEKQQEQLIMAAEAEAAGRGEPTTADDSNTKSLATTPAISKLTLKEGETIHITLKGMEGSSTTKEHKKAAASHGSSSSSGGMGVAAIPLLKKKPPTLGQLPPPPSANLPPVGLRTIVKTEVVDDDEDEWTEFQES